MLETMTIRLADGADWARRPAALSAKERFRPMGWAFDRDCRIARRFRAAGWGELALAIFLARDRPRSRSGRLHQIAPASGTAILGAETLRADFADRRAATWRQSGRGATDRRASTRPITFGGPGSGSAGKSRVTAVDSAPQAQEIRLRIVRTVVTAGCWLYALGHSGPVGGVTRGARRVAAPLALLWPLAGHRALVLLMPWTVWVRSKGSLLALGTALVAFTGIWGSSSGG